jgi:hypothetical protein
VTLKPLLAALTLIIGLAGCDALKSSRSDGLPLSEVKMDGRAPIAQAALADARFTVTSVDVIVPETLRVSEANSFYPNADVVWRGEPQGDRLAQIKSIVEEGLTAGIANLATGPKAVLSVQLERFHALTEKARFSVGGVHDVVFVLTMLDAKTGAVLEGPRRVEIAIKAAGSDVAIAEDAAGRTQRVVIVEGVAEAIRRELSGPPPSAAPRRRGLFAGFN